ncbi:PREDICTED: plasma kallikrein-like [Ceratosolen solmsi marchali]|uniref:Plasma kallikrein-like n=1 Tax=Ceratosolen solmsi marchali TaxID=326594 RepID=A0AAJ7E2B7_9HYME|nr:PREDICTED: plasma kallikrein-like [Ceratosolen solmsi marchali]
MILRLVIFLCLEIVTGTLGKHVKIIGGQNANIEDYPFMARLRKRSDRKTVCGGIIITKQHILTAAHCFDNLPYSAVTVHTGSTLNSVNEPSFAIKEIEIHPEYIGVFSENNQLYNDIAVAQLYTCLHFNQFQNKINLPIRNTEFDDRAQILGWGKTSCVGCFYEILQVATTTILKNEDCAQFFPYSIASNQICTHEQDGVGISISDSGGPLIDNNGELVGIASICNLYVIDVLGKKYTRIIGGMNVEIKDYPFMVALKHIKDKVQYCGGAIITKRHIITAAHCVDIYPYHEIRAYIGSNARSSTGPSYELERVNIHPGYTGNMMRESCLYHDIAVVTVKGCMHFNRFQHAVKLPTDNIEVGTTTMIIGWGTTSYPEGEPSEILQMAKMKILKTQECITATRYAIRAIQVCAFNGNGVGTCIGDSGGPLINTKGVLVGIASFCYLCAKGLPDVYTRIFYYLEFINRIINPINFQCCTIL